MKTLLFLSTLLILICSCSKEELIQPEKSQIKSKIQGQWNIDEKHRIEFIGDSIYETTYNSKMGITTIEVSSYNIESLTININQCYLKVDGIKYFKYNDNSHYVISINEKSLYFDSLFKGIKND